jgi:hypothetical protein
MTRGEPPQKSLLPINAEECFVLLHLFMGVAWVWKIKTGLGFVQWLLKN